MDQVLSDAPIVDEDDKGRRRTIWDMAENFIYIIWSIRYVCSSGYKLMALMQNLISESSDKHIKAVNRLNIIAFLISFLSSADRIPTRVVIAAGM